MLAQSPNQLTKTPLESNSEFRIQNWFRVFSYDRSCDFVDRL